MPVACVFLAIAAGGCAASPKQSEEVTNRASPTTIPALLEELLKQRAPSEDWRVRLGWASEAQVQFAEEHWVPSRPPDKDASLDAVLSFWASTAELGYLDQSPPGTQEWLNETERERLVNAMVRRPKSLRLISAFPLMLQFLNGADQRTHNQLKTLLDRASGMSVQKGEIDWRPALHRWLMLNSRYFRDELIAHAKALQMPGQTTYDEKNAEALNHLAKLDWYAARDVALLQARDPSASRDVVAVALAALHSGGMSAGDKLAARDARQKLQAIASDPAASAVAMDVALRSLIEVNWAGEVEAQNKWVLASLANAKTALELRGRDTVFQPFAFAMSKNPERWISLLLPLIGGKDRRSHDRAVSLVLKIARKPQLRRVLPPMLPWLSDPKWSAADERVDFIRDLAQVELPESVPGLLKVLQAESGDARLPAAIALGHFRAKEAAPLVRATLQQSWDYPDRIQLGVALVQCGGVTPEDGADAVVTYAIWRIGIGGRPQPEEWKQALGHAICNGGISADIASVLSVEIESLRTKDPELSAHLLEMLSQSDSLPAARYLLQRGLNADADATSVAALAAGAPIARQRAARELRNVATGGGFAAGIAAAILGDEAIIRQKLQGKDRAAVAGLLSTARLSRTLLPLECVIPLLTRKDARVAFAAEEYLVSDGRHAATEAVLAHHPGEVMIIGHNGIDPILATIRAEIAARETVEAFVLESGGGFGGAGDRIVRVRKDGSVLLSFYPTGRDASPRERTIAAEELADLRQFIRKRGFDDFPPMPFHGVHDGIWYDYVHVTPAGGRVISINNPVEGTPYDELVLLFYQLAPRSN